MQKKLSLVLLVGGKSSRMRQDKSALKLSVLSHNISSDDILANSDALSCNEVLSNHTSFEDEFSSHHALSQNISNKSTISSTQHTRSSCENKKLLNIAEDKEFFAHALFLLYSLSKANPHIATEIKVSCRANQYEFMKNRVDKLQAYEMQSNIENLNDVNFELILDDGLGVCEAISLCLEKTQSACLFIPCDVPFLTLQLLQELIDAWDKDVSSKNITFHDAYASYVFIDENQKKQSLIAIYTQKALPYLTASLPKKIPLQKMLPEELSKLLPYTAAQEIFFQNMNTIKDLDSAKSHVLQASKPFIKS